MNRLPGLPDGRREVSRWVRTHLADLCGDVGEASSIPGGQQAADAALAAFDVRGYADHRNEAWPPSRRGASGLSPYIRHGLLTLGRVWNAVEGGPDHDVSRFRDELLWQEYARHLYARMGTATRHSLRFSVPERGSTDVDRAHGGPDADHVVGEHLWSGDEACLSQALQELRETGWLPNQMRMWLASHWSVRQGGWLARRRGPLLSAPSGRLTGGQPRGVAVDGWCTHGQVVWLQSLAGPEASTRPVRLLPGRGCVPDCGLAS